MKKDCLLASCVLITCLLIFTTNASGQDDCKGLVKSAYDKYEDGYRFNTYHPEKRNDNSQLFFLKTVKKGLSEYFLGLEVLTDTPYYPQTDFVILFIGNRRIVRKDYTINVEVNKSKLAYKAVTLIPLTSGERAMFSKEILEGFRIQADDFEIKVLDALQIRKEFDCLVKAKPPVK